MDRSRIDRTRLLLYGIGPAVVGVGLVAAYYSQVGWLQRLIAPDNREFGLLENLQNLTLLVMIALCVRSGMREQTIRARVAWFGIAALSALVLGEELDWGMHYYRAWNDLQNEDAIAFNLHNAGRRTKRLMAVVDTVTILAFAVAPFLIRYIPHRLKLFVPSPYSLLTLLVIVGTGHLAHGLEDHDWDHNDGLRYDMSEFREVHTYWLALLYLGELSMRRGRFTRRSERGRTNRRSAPGV